MSELLTRYMALFKGLDRAHGTYKVSGVITEKGKRDGKGATLFEPPTAALYERHLRGEYMLGIVPITDANTCWFAALDVDDYTGKYVPIVERIRESNLPLVPVLSKSSGVHLYLFFSEPVPCDLARAKLKELSEFLGIPGVEIFPKQDVLSNKDEVGNWLNIPYYKGLLGPAHAERLMVDPRTQEKIADLGKFLDIAERMRITAAQLDGIAVEAKKRAKAPFADGPPCLQKLAMSKVGEGGRNNALYQFGVYLREKHQNTPGYSEQRLLELLQGVNKEYYDPPLEASEVLQTTKSVFRDRGFYQCGNQPQVSLCNRALCLRRKYGIGDPDTQPDKRLEYGGLTKYEIQDDNGGLSTQEDPWYDFTVNGRNIRFTWDELYNPEFFRQRVAKVLNVFPPAMKKGDWEKFVDSCFTSMQIVAVPFESGPKGQLVGHVRDFVRDYGQREEWDALLDGGAYVDRPNKCAYFRWQDLLAYLNRKNARGHKQNEVFAVVQQHMAGRNGDKNISGKHVRYWCVAVADTDMPPTEEMVNEF
jgi:hypothetical protein